MIRWFTIQFGFCFRQLRLRKVKHTFLNEQQSRMVLENEMELFEVYNSCVSLERSEKYHLKQ